MRFVYRGKRGDFARQSLLSLCGHARKCQLRVSLFEPKLEDAQLVHSTRHDKINVFLDLWISGSGKPFETWRSSLRFSSDSIMRSLARLRFRENPNRRYGGKKNGRDLIKLIEFRIHRTRSCRVSIFLANKERRVIKWLLLSARSTTLNDSRSEAPRRKYFH